MTARRGPSEKEFLAQVVALARLRGWFTYHTHDSRRSTAGFPDLILCRRERIIAAELKVGNRQPTPEQEAWLVALWIAGVQAEVWRPSAWPEIEAALE